MEIIKKINVKNNKTLLLLVGRIDAGQNSMSDSSSTSNIRTTGWLDEVEMKKALCMADIVLVPSVYLDPFPTVNLEAMAAMKPVVGTCFGGTPEAVVDGVTGFVTNPYDTGQMADKIQYLLDNPDIAKKNGRSRLSEGRKRIFSRRANTENIILV